IYDGNTPVLVVAKPDLIKAILVQNITDFRDRRPRRLTHPILSKNLFHIPGHEWRRLRAIASPTFSSVKLRKIYEMMRQCLRDLMDQVLEVRAVEGQTLDLLETHGSYTMDVIGTVAFATKTQPYNNPDNQFVRCAAALGDLNVLGEILAILLPKFVCRLLGYKSSNNESNNEFLMNAIKHVIRQRTAEPNKVEAVVDPTGEIGYDDLTRLPFLDAVLSESLRKYPPIVMLSRQAVNDYTIPDSGIVIPKGQHIEIPVYAVHHNPEYYPNPEKFDPDRFMPENRDKIKPYTYLPFGAGPRNCIGMRVALMEAKLCIAHLVRRYILFPTNETPVPIKYRAGKLILATDKLEICMSRVSDRNRLIGFSCSNHYIITRSIAFKSYTYLPFGAGPHNCIGMRVALMEAKLCIAHLVRRYRLFPTDETPVPIKYRVLKIVLVCHQVIVGIKKLDISYVANTNFPTLYLMGTGVSLEGNSVYRLTRCAIHSLASISATRIPMQLRGPAPKGSINRYLNVLPLRDHNSRVGYCVVVHCLSAQHYNRRGLRQHGVQKGQSSQVVVTDLTGRVDHRLHLFVDPVLYFGIHCQLIGAEHQCIGGGVITGQNE
ncbi:unnamed protein product, partial [Oppiella nova]